MITFKEVSLQRGTKELFDHISLTIFAGQKVGIIGANGSGKSSLFALLLGQLQPDVGDLFIQSNMRIAHLSQDMPDDIIPAIQFVMNGDKQLAYVLREIKHAESIQDDIALGALHSRLYEIDGYAAQAKAGKLLDGLGFKKSEHEKPVNQFSGGWRMRLNLAQVLMDRSDLMLLDEPTNHLDMDAIIWLERYLKQYEGTLLLISHDREFLDNVVDRVAFVYHQKIEMYGGNYSTFETQRALKLANEQALFEKQQAKIAHLEKFVNRFRYKASKAKQAQSRLKMLERMERVVLTHIDSPFSFGFFDTKDCSPPLINFEKADFAYGKHLVLKNINFGLNPGDRIGLLGRNGAGKSTFMKLLGRQHEVISGQSWFNKDLRIGYFAQHQLEQLNTHESPMFHFWELNSKLREQEIRDYLGGFGFKGDMVFQSIEHFSGGEKSRLVLALLVWQKPNLLLLDEPTNHLDMNMREALAYALQEFSGTLVLVSHDRYLLKATVDEFYLVHDKKVARFDGNIADYQEWLFQEKKETIKEDQAAPLKQVREKKPKPKPEKLQQIEAKLELLYLEKQKLEHDLSNHDLYSDANKSKLLALQKQLKTIEKSIKDNEDKWLEDV